MRCRVAPTQLDDPPLQTDARRSSLPVRVRPRTGVRLAEWPRAGYFCGVIPSALRRHQSEEGVAQGVKRGIAEGGRSRPGPTREPGGIRAGRRLLPIEGPTAFQAN